MKTTADSGAKASRLARTLIQKLTAGFEPKRYRTTAVVTSVQRDSTERVIGALATIDGLGNQPVAVDFGAPMAAGDVYLVENQGSQTATAWTTIRRLRSSLGLPPAGGTSSLPTPGGLVVDSDIIPSDAGPAAWLYASCNSVDDSFGSLTYCFELRPDGAYPVVEQYSTLDVMETSFLAVAVDDTVTIVTHTETADTFAEFGRFKIESELISYTAYSAGTGDTGTGVGGTNIITDSSKAWTTNQWVDFAVVVSGTTYLITGNSATELYVVGTPASGTYTIYPAFSGCTRGVGGTDAAAHTIDKIIIRRSIGTALGGPRALNVGYNVRVRTEREAQNAFSPWSAWVSTATAEDTTPPPDPTGFALEQWLSGVILSWIGPTRTTTPDLASFQVYQATDSSGTGATMIMDVGLSYIARVDLLPGETRYFNLKALDVFGNESGYAVATWLEGYAVVGPGGQLLLNADLESVGEWDDQAEYWCDGDPGQYYPSAPHRLLGSFTSGGTYNWPWVAGTLGAYGYNGGQGYQFVLPAEDTDLDLGYVAALCQPGQTCTNIIGDTWESDYLRTWEDDQWYGASILVYTTASESLFNFTWDLDVGTFYEYEFPVDKITFAITPGTHWVSAFPVAEVGETNSSVVFEALGGNWYRIGRIRQLVAADRTNSLGPDRDYVGFSMIVCNRTSSAVTLAFDRAMLTRGQQLPEWQLATDYAAPGRITPRLSLDAGRIKGTYLDVGPDGKIRSDLLPSTTGLDLGASASEWDSLYLATLLLSNYGDITGISTPANPASGTRRLFVDTGTGALSVRTSAGGTISLEGGGVSDHGALTGLSDDDHPQYAAIAQNETVSVAWTFQSYTDVQGISTPSDPSSGTRRLFVDSGTGKMSVRTSGGSTISLEEGGPGSVPTGTGFRHVTSGVEDSAAKLVVDEDVSASAGIGESKLALNFPTHAQLHDITGADHNATGLTVGHVIRATGSTSFEWSQLLHDQLGGLSDDDHPQYAGIGQTETITGAWTFSLGAGAPFVCVSGAAKVTYLDADKLDGYEATAFPRKDEAATITGAWTFQADIQADCDLDFVGAQSITTTTGDLTLAPAGDVLLNPTGAEIRVQSSHTIQSDSFSSQTTGWGIDYSGAGDFRNLFTDQLHARVQIADLEQALAGLQIISKSVAILSQDFVAPWQGGISSIWESYNCFTVAGDQRAYIDDGSTFEVTGTTYNNGIWTVDYTELYGGNTDIYVDESIDYDEGAGGYIGFQDTLYVYDLPSAANMAVFESGDIVGLRQFSRASGALTITDLWGVVTNYTDLTGEQSWTFTRSTGSDAGAMAPGTTVLTDALVLDYGVSGNGYYEVNSVDGTYAANAPYAQIVTWASHPATGKTVRVRLGQLQGVTSEDELGLFVGDGISAASHYLLMSDQDIEVHNLASGWYDSGNQQRIGISPDATSSQQLLWAGPASGASSRFVVYGDGDVWLSTLAISQDAGAYIFSQTGGLALWGPSQEIDGTYWTSSREQVVTIGGAFQQVAGRWPGTKALMVETECTNLVTNPSFATGLTGWTTAGTNSIAQSTTQSKYDGYSLKATFQDSQYLAYSAVTVTAVDHGFSAWIWVPKEWDGGTIYVIPGNFASGTNHDAVNWVPGTDPTETWFRISRYLTPDAGDLDGHIQIRTTSDPTAGRFIYIDGAQVEAKHVTSTCIGSMEWCTWTGTEHASTSHRAATTPAVSPAPTFSMATGSVSMWIRTYRIKLSDGALLWQAGTPNAELDAYYSYSDALVRLRANGAVVCTATAALEDDTWYHLAFTWDFPSSSQVLYINGVAQGSPGTDSVTPTIAGTGGIGYSAVIGVLYNLNGAIAEFATSSEQWTAEQVAALYALQRPIVDAGAIEPGGIYILDGNFKLASSVTGTRIEITPDEIAGYNGSTKQFYLQASDGKAYTAAGKVQLDNSGVKIHSASILSPLGTNKVSWTDTTFATTHAEVYGGYEPTGSGHYLYLNAIAVSTGYSADAILRATNGTNVATVTARVLTSNATKVEVNTDLTVNTGLYVGNSSGDPDADDIHYDGNLKSMKNSTYYDVFGLRPLTTALTSTSFDGDAKSTTAATLIDMSATFSGFPAGAKAALVRLVARDSASFPTNSLYFSVGPSSGDPFAVSVRPLGGDYYAEAMGICPCTAAGDIYYRIEASGTSTMDVWLTVYGYLI